MNTPIQEIKSLVAENRSSDALSRLLELSQNNKQVHDAIHLVLAEFNDLTAQRLKGTIENSEATRRLNIIHDKILIALGAFDSAGRVLPGSALSDKKSATATLGKFSILFGGLSIVIALLEYFITGKDALFALAPLGLFFFTFIAYLLAMVASSFKK